MADSLSALRQGDLSMLENLLNEINKIEIQDEHGARPLKLFDRAFIIVATGN